MDHKKEPHKKVLNNRRVRLFSKIIEQQCHQKVTLLEGGGAAWTAAGMVGFRSSTHFRVWVALRVDWVRTKGWTSRSCFTAEGKSTTIAVRKSSCGWARVAKISQKCIGLRLSNLLFFLYDQGFSGIFNLQQGPISLQESKETLISCSVQLLDVFFNFT